MGLFQLSERRLLQAGGPPGILHLHRADLHGGRDPSGRQGEQGHAEKNSSHHEVYWKFNHLETKSI